MPTKTYYSVAGEIIAEETGGVRTDYITDALGSIVGTVDSSQAVVNTYRFKPYGALLAKTGTGPDPRFLWTGNTGSRTTNLNRAEQYNRARHLGVKEGSWTTVDPLWPDERAYEYVNGNPTTNTDPSGNCREFPLDCPNYFLVLELERKCQLLGSAVCLHRFHPTLSTPTRMWCCGECFDLCDEVLINGGVVCDGTDEKSQRHCAIAAVNKFKGGDKSANLGVYPRVLDMNHCGLCAPPSEDPGQHFQWKCKSKRKVISAACCPCMSRGKVKIACLTTKPCHNN